MARDPAAAPRLIPLPVHPWVFILGGLGLVLLSWLIGKMLPAAAFVRVILALGGAGSAIAGVVVRLRRCPWMLHDRIETAAMIATAGLSCLVGWFCMSEDWDSGKFLFGALFIVSLAGSMLVILPTVGRKIFLSLFVLFHFGGMATAITAIDPPNNTGPWVSKQLWARVYYPYLQFLYLTNAYHFYSPDPGPPSTLWFYVMYEDGSRTLVKFPDKKNSAVGMQYQRQLALPEHSFQALPNLPLSASQIQEVQLTQKDFRQPRGSWEDVYRRRENGSLHKYPASWQEKGKTVERGLQIPMIYERDLSIYNQYREPNPTSKELIASVARRVFLTAPKKLDEAGNEVPVKSVKAYRITQWIVTPQELAKGMDPWEPTKRLPYFLGEFDGEGTLVDQYDPFLYWYLPVINAQEGYKTFQQPPLLRTPPYERFGMPASGNTFVLDGVEMHAAGQLRQKGGK